MRSEPIGCNPLSNPDALSRVATIPVIDTLCNGSCDVSILTFAMFFLEGVECGGKGQGNSCTLAGRYVRAVIAPYDPEGSISFVRLVE